MLDGSCGRAALQVQETKVLVFGDIMLDQYMIGKATRLCPEAPVPVVIIERTEWKLGGAGNIAANLKALGAEVVLMGLIGSDGEGEKIRQLAMEQGISFIALEGKGRATTVKQRIMVQGRLLLRIDREDTDDMESSLRRAFMNKMAAIEDVAAVVISDYGKGAVHEELTGYLANHYGRKAIPLYVDPKGDNYGKYFGADVIKPNFSELEQVYRKPIKGLDDLQKAAGMVFEAAACKKCIVTWGENGAILFHSPTDWVHIPAVVTPNPVDVTGAGDVFLASYVYGKLAGLTDMKACRMANRLAAYSVSKTGTGTVTRDDWTAIGKEEGF